MAVGPGAADAEGVWRFGEADNPTGLQSDTLNLLAASVSAQFTLDRARILTAEKRTYVAVSSAARDTYFGAPASAAARLLLQNSGAECRRTDLGWTERYFAGLTDGGSNPGGATVAGWYPVDGKLPSYEATLAGTAAVTTGTVAALTEVKRQNMPAHASNVLTPGVAGWYEIVYDQQWNFGTAGANVTGAIRKGGSTIAASTVPSLAAAGVATSVPAIVFLTSTDTIDFLASASASTARVATGSRVGLRYLGVG